MRGQQLIFRVEEVSLLDINDLIDKGKRFTLKSGLPDDEYDNLEEYLNAQGDNRTTISTRECFED